MMGLALLGLLGIGTIALFNDKIIAKIKEEIGKKVEEEKQKFIDKINEKKEEFLDTINPFKEKTDLDSEEKKEADKLIEELKKEQTKAEREIQAAGLDLPDAETPPAVAPSPNQEAPTVQPARTPAAPKPAETTPETTETTSTTETTPTPSTQRRRQRRRGSGVRNAPQRLQSGGAVGAATAIAVSGNPVYGGAKSGTQASVKDARLLTTSDFVKKKKPLAKYQSGGLVLFQGHGDVPAGHSAPGTDGPGTKMQGKYKPTAEQYWVDQVATKAEKLAASEGVSLTYQRPTGKYASASHPKSNWSLANSLRRQGQAAVELHFDAWGYQGDKYIEGKRGMLTSGSKLLPAEQALQTSFGTHPMSGKGWGTMMLELDALKYATSRTDQYARMLVDAAKGTGKSDYTAEETDPENTDLTTPTPETSGGDTEGTDMNSLSSVLGPGLGAYFTEFFSLLGQELGGGLVDLLMGPVANAVTTGGPLMAMLTGGASFTSLFGGGEQQKPQQDGHTPNAPTSSAPISGDMKGKAVTIAKRLMEDQGISAAAAAGVVGNLMLESGLDPDNVENGKGFADGAINNVPAGTKRVGYGYGQWTNDRLESFRAWLTERGKADSPATDEDNYQYLLHELNNKEPLRNHWKTGTSILWTTQRRLPLGL